MSLMNFKEFKQIKRLNIDELNRIISSADAQERVWAAWEIGLRLGNEAIPGLAHAVSNAPDPGTRRHMVVVLAGFQQIAVLKTLSLYDPDDIVRATASQYLMKISDSNSGISDFILVILENDDSVIVKQYILCNWHYKEPIPIPLLYKCLLNSSVDVQREASNLLIVQYKAVDLSRDKIVSCLIHQTSKDTINLISNWLLTWNMNEVLITAAENTPEPICILILDFLKDSAIKLPWAI